MLYLVHPTNRDSLVGLYGTRNAIILRAESESEALATASKLRDFGPCTPDRWSALPLDDAFAGPMIIETRALPIRLDRASPTGATTHGGVLVKERIEPTETEPDPDPTDPKTWRGKAL